MKKITSFILSLVFMISVFTNVCGGYYDDGIVSAANVDDPQPFDLDCVSAVLMDYSTGTVLYDKNGTVPLPPASVTKIMTLLLTMEAIDEGRLELDDMLQVSEYGASMGGSQVYLEPGETMSVEELIKCVVIASANDAAVTLAEAVAGSESAFVNTMNERAAALGMNNTSFENATGLDDTTVNHVTSALDIAIMSRELMKHPLIFKYSSIWMDSIRNGAFGLTNTNRLVRFYSGATGLKTGSTSKAKFCISATACRDNLHLIAVIMGAPTRDVRNEAAKKLLDYGFANYSIYSDAEKDMGKVKVLRGTTLYCNTTKGTFTALVSKGDASKVICDVSMKSEVDAPVKEGDILGEVTYKIDERAIGKCDIVASQSVESISFFELLRRMFASFTVSE